MRKLHAGGTRDPIVGAKALEKAARTKWPKLKAGDIWNRVNRNALDKLFAALPVVGCHEPNTLELAELLTLLPKTRER